MDQKKSLLKIMSNIVFTNGNIKNLKWRNQSATSKDQYTFTSLWAYGRFDLKGFDIIITIISLLKKGIGFVIVKPYCCTSHPRLQTISQEIIHHHHLHHHSKLWDQDYFFFNEINDFIQFKLIKRIFDQINLALVSIRDFLQNYLNILQNFWTIVYKTATLPI